MGHRCLHRPRLVDPSRRPGIADHEAQQGQAANAEDEAVAGGDAASGGCRAVTGTVTVIAGHWQGPIFPSPHRGKGAPPPPPPPPPTAAPPTPPRAAP